MAIVGVGASDRSRLMGVYVAGGTRYAPGVEIRGAVCLVTGATSGIGRATALRLAWEGARVLSLGRDPQALKDIVARTAGVGIRADLADPAEADRAAEEALAA